MVPTAVAQIIKAKNLFGWRPRQDRDMALPPGRVADARTDT
jgi:hypothetical protein